VLEPAAWIEGIPFNETRDYVKKVLSNAVVYAARLQATQPRAASPAASAASATSAASAASAAESGADASAPAPAPLSAVGPASLRARLGQAIGPRDPAAPAENRELP